MPVSYSCSKWYYVVFWFKYVVCCMVGNGVRAEQLGVWIIALQRNFYTDRYRAVRLECFSPPIPQMSDGILEIPL